MKRRVLFLALAAGFLVLGFGALDARAGFVPLPTTLDQFVGANSANYTTVANGGNLLQFSNFSYTAVTSAPPSASGVTLDPIPTPPGTGPETGIQIGGAFNSPATVTNDWILTYTVTVLGGSPITDASLSVVGGLGGGNGSFDVTENLSSGGHTFASLEAYSNTGAGTKLDDHATFAGLTTFQVSKDIDVIGGSSTTTSLSIIDQTFSQSGSSVPEPASLALLGIGMTGFLAFRRFFKKTSVA